MKARPASVYKTLHSERMDLGARAWISMEWKSVREPTVLTDGAKPLPYSQDLPFRRKFTLASLYIMCFLLTLVFEPNGDNKLAPCYTLAVNRGFLMTKTAAISVASQVRRLAKFHKVTAERDGMSRMAVAITRMAGDSVELDNIEQLLVNLKRKGVLSKSEILTLQGGYLQEKRRSRKKISV
ncbi:MULTISPECIES: hypothetical protein [unclassified Brenneria]|uniref:hypothetical protein n=1 Tax=unclassified Brenneria TaxID=2634434 RepID=UPI0029C463C1|nr:MULTISPECIES: hypothetical protein [unclassified Brenneria]MDX5629607.1 hypothetical protein [Brenneria sp. L3-3Z]MDX5696753.1 hypothetical protein [Brenneria sp. L4-2C]